jgi:hypothetical protein
MKPLVLLWTLSAMFAIATDSDLPMSPDRELEVNNYNRQLSELYQSSCTKPYTSRELLSAATDLVDDVDAASNICSNPGTPCLVNFPSLPSYNSFKSACSAAKGVFATYDASILCKIGAATPYFNSVWNSSPYCLISEQVDKNCGPVMFADELHDYWETSYTSYCSITVINTGYTDYSGSKPVKKPVKKPIKKPVKKPVKRPVRRRAMAVE